MVNFELNQNARHTTVIPFPTLLGLLPQPSESVRTVIRAYAEVITKFLGSIGSQFSFISYGASRARTLAALLLIYSMTSPLCRC